MSESMENPFRNSGEKIKELAVVLHKINKILYGILGALTPIVLAVSAGGLGFVLGLLCGAMVFVVGWFMSWISCLLLYAFGTLVENSEKTDKKKRDGSATEQKEQFEKNSQIKTTEDDSGVYEAVSDQTMPNVIVKRTVGKYIFLDCPGCKEEFFVHRNQESIKCPFCHLVMKKKT